MPSALTNVPSTSARVALYATYESVILNLDDISCKYTLSVNKGTAK